MDIETSAKAGKNVETLFLTITKEIIEKIKSKENGPDNAARLKDVSDKTKGKSGRMG